MTSLQRGGDEGASALIVKMRDFVPALGVARSEEGNLRRTFGSMVVTRSKSGSYPGNDVYKAQSPNGDVFALKLLDSPKDLIAQADAGDAADSASSAIMRHRRERAFAEEWRGLLTVSSLKGFPRAYGYGRAEVPCVSAAEQDSAKKGATEKNAPATITIPAIVMEWIEGVTLREARTELPAYLVPDAAGVARRCLQPDTVVAIGCALADILVGTLALDRHFLHRDLSPRNVFVRTSAHSVAEQAAAGSFSLCIVDMGSSTALDEDERGATLGHDLWRFGTAEYAAPEMLTRDVPRIAELRYSETIDTYAVCSMLYELLCDRTPFELSLRPEASPYLTKMNECPVLPSWLRGAARELAKLLARGLDAEQSRRYTILELSRVLHEWEDPSATPS